MTNTNFRFWILDFGLQLGDSHEYPCQTDALLRWPGGGVEEPGSSGVCKGGLLFLVITLGLMLQGCATFRHVTHSTPIGAVYNGVADFYNALNALDPNSVQMDYTEPWPVKYAVVDPDSGLRQGATKDTVRGLLGAPTVESEALWWYSPEYLQHRFPRSEPGAWKIIEFMRRKKGRTYPEAINYLKDGQVTYIYLSDRGPYWVVDEDLRITTGMTKDEVEQLLGGRRLVVMLSERGSYWVMDEDLRSATDMTQEEQLLGLRLLVAMREEWWYPITEEQVLPTGPLAGRWRRVQFIDGLVEFGGPAPSAVMLADSDTGIAYGMSKEEVVRRLGPPTLANPLGTRGRWYYAPEVWAAQFHRSASSWKMLVMGPHGVEYILNETKAPWRAELDGVLDGMSREDVRRVWGEPQQAFSYPWGEDWWYQKPDRESWRVARFNQFGRIFYVAATSRSPHAADEHGRFLLDQ